MTTTAPLAEALLGFCRHLRAAGMDVGVAESLAALDVASLGLVPGGKGFRQALRTLLCTSADDWHAFDAHFEAYWRGARPARVHRERFSRSLAEVPLRHIGVGRADPAARDDGAVTTGASPAERLRRTDFGAVEEPDREVLAALARRLWRQMSRRLRRTLRAAPRGRQVHLRHTFRRNIPQGGDLIALRYRRRRTRPPRLVVLLDVSGSMDAYSLFFLRFVHALRGAFRNVEVFLFSTRLTRITPVLARGLSESLRAVAREAEDWSGGTRIGACLEAFLAGEGRRLVTRHTRVLVLSDGLDTGPPDVLAAALARLHRRAGKLLWLNPLLGSTGYAPGATAMAAALPHVDAFLAAHNLESLLALEPHLTHV